MKLPFMPQSELAREQREYLEQMVSERTASLREANEKLTQEVRERVMAQVALQQSLEYQHTINMLLNLAQQPISMEALLGRVLDMVLSLPALDGMSAGAIFVVDRPGTLTLKAHRGMPEGMSQGCAEVEIGQCHCGQAAQECAFMQVPQLGPEAAGRCGNAEYCGGFSLPFSVNGEPLGVLYVLLPRDWVPDESEVQILGGVADVLANIISRKQGEARRAELEDQLRYSQKLEAVGRLAGGVAHDFNNLLTIIQGNVFLNLSEPDLPEQLRQDLEGIEAASRRAATLTRQLLAFGRKEVLCPHEIQVNTIVGELQKMLRRVIGEDVDLRTSLSDNLWPTWVDPGQLEQVILNLAVNARDAMPRGGQLLLETANVHLSPTDADRGAAISPGAYVQLTVSDTGIGMDSKVFEHIFEPFFSTKEVVEGSSGLGLSTAYGIVRQSGGHIRVQSELGRGTSFFIYLPRLLAAEEGDGDRETNARQEVTSEVHAQERSILVVEDDKDVRLLVRRLLRRAGYQVLEASNSLRALEKNAEYSGDIHLVLTDVIMPGLSGKELAEMLHVGRPDLEVLFMSGYSGEALRGRGLKADRFLPKPFTPQELLDAVASVLESSELRRANLGANREEK